MRTFLAWVSRLFGSVGGGRDDAAITEELAFHLEMQERLEQSRGASAEEAHRRARTRLGGVDQTAENLRDQRGLPWLDLLRQDLRYAARMFRRDFGFTAIALITLALGIGATTAIFSLLKGVVLAPLPYPAADRLVRVYESIPTAADIPRHEGEPAPLPARSTHHRGDRRLHARGSAVVARGSPGADARRAGIEQLLHRPRRDARPRPRLHVDRGAR